MDRDATRLTIQRLAALEAEIGSRCSSYDQAAVEHQQTFDRMRRIYDRFHKRCRLLEKMQEWAEAEADEWNNLCKQYGGTRVFLQELSVELGKTLANINRIRHEANEVLDQAEADDADWWKGESEG